MSALVVEGGSGLRVAEIPVRDPSPGEVLVEVARCGVCGSDLRSLGAGTLADGVVLGHETAGTIVAVGADVDDRTVGDRVAVNPFAPCGSCPECSAGHGHLCPEAIAAYLGGGRTPGAFAPFVTVPARTTFALPDALDLRHAALAEPLAVAIHALRLPAVRLPASMAVIGAGPIGLLVALAARSLSDAPVVLLSNNPARTAFARELGLTTIDTSGGADAAFEGPRPEIVVECAGSPEALDLALGLVRARGTVVGVGVVRGPIQITPARLLRKEAVVCGSLAYADCDFREAIALLSDGQIPAEGLISAEPGLRESPELIQRMLSGSSELLKVLVDPHR